MTILPPLEKAEGVGIARSVQLCGLFVKTGAQGAASEVSRSRLACLFDLLLA